AFILPFFRALGYDPFNLSEIVPEFNADFQKNKKPNCIDYCIFKNDSPILLVECKSINEKLEEEEKNQLQGYFSACAKNHVKFAILTNGQEYKFYADMDKDNIMDDEPFWQFNITTEIKDTDMEQLYQFHKKKFNQEEITENAKRLKYYNAVQEVIKKQFSDTDDDFVKFILGKISNEKKTEQRINMLKPIIKDVFDKIIKDNNDKQFENKITQGIKKENTQCNNNHTNKENSGQLIVIFEDGTKFQYLEPKITLAKTIEKIGFEKVVPLEIKHNEIYLISKEKTKFKTRQYGDYYIHTTGSPKTKKKQLQEISEKLGLNLKIELLQNK
ncbi:MAG: type I restriction enzyme HsdR N-terminal domain-containing protein, partial [Neisseriaceae bacterium]|nr:type I restriction enzyme HsdR N-terminal domain-containing protein [Neisseriaceae bacterium]